MNEINLNKKNLSLLIKEEVNTLLEQSETYIDGAVTKIIDSIEVRQELSEKQKAAIRGLVEKTAKSKEGKSAESAEDLAQATFKKFAKKFGMKPSSGDCKDEDAYKNKKCLYKGVMEFFKKVFEKSGQQAAFRQLKKTMGKLTKEYIKDYNPEKEMATKLFKDKALKNNLEGHAEYVAHRVYDKLLKSGKMEEVPPKNDKQDKSEPQKAKPEPKKAKPEPEKPVVKQITKQQIESITTEGREKFQRAVGTIDKLIVIADTLNKLIKANSDVDIDRSLKRTTVYKVTGKFK